MNRKLLTALLLCFTAGISFGQDTLTGPNFNPVAGDAFITVNAHPRGIDPGASGPSVIWNFSGLDTMSIDTAIATPCAFVHPVCDWAFGSNLGIATFSANIVNYIYEDNSRLSQFGTYFSTSDNFYFTDPMDQFHYPFTYLSTFNDTYAGVVHYVPTGSTLSVTANVVGTINVNCDAWGTLEIPGHTYHNVLRVHNIQKYIDTANLFGVGVADSFQLDSYTWYESNFHTGLMNVSYNAQLGTSTPLLDTIVTFTARPLQNLVPKILGIDATLKIFPNPVSDELNINFTVPLSEQVRVSLLDMLGREIAVISDKYSYGSEELKYNTSSLPTGLYVVRLQSGAEITTRKIEVR